ncbi:MAG: GNAT family N-acetyltransferase [Sphingobacteriales bacterium]|nr:MAG: GNAT family N-acetyltransferase [Sphingobacteriales bacterium]
MSQIVYKTGVTPAAELIVEVYDSAGLARPTQDLERIANMYANSNLVATAWDGDRLVGISRSITDFYWVCYLSDLAVRSEYQRAGIGKQLVQVTKETVGEQTMLLLLSVPGALDYYPRLGMEKVDYGFLIKRSY